MRRPCKNGRSGNCRLPAIRRRIEEGATSGRGVKYAVPARTAGPATTDSLPFAEE